jgi:ubiquinone/menaquinone biosynthesis C-methylase UbiE
MSSRNVWNRYASYFNAEEGTVFPHDIREMNFYRGLRREYSTDCLEIGAGSGRLARALLGGGTTFALEPSDGMISSWSPGDSSLTLRIQATGEQLPFPGNSFQFVCFPYNGLQCVLDPCARKSVILEAFRVTRPGGVFLLEVSPVFGRRNEEPLTERYHAELPEGKELLLREEVRRCPGSGNIKYHMFYTVIDHTGETTDEIILELASMDMEEVKGMLLEAGFVKLTFWGDYDRSGYDEELSPRLLVQSEKGA